MVCRPLLHFVVLCATLLLLGIPTRGDVVHLKNGRSIEGVVAEGASSDDDELWVQITDTGGTRLRGADVERIERKPLELAEIVPVSARIGEQQAQRQGRRLPTTHRVLMKNGRIILGNLIESDDPQLITLEIGSMGTFSFDRELIEAVEEHSGELIIAPRGEKTVHIEGEGPSTTEQEEQQAFVQWVSAITERTLHRYYEEHGRDHELSAQDREDIERAAYELTRHRAQNRTRAERRLADWGPAALPYLRPLSNHPFNLTRTSVMRLVGGYQVTSGALIAIDGLDDADIHVRRAAYDALRQVFSEEIKYNSSWTSRRRQQIQDIYRGLWLRAEADLLQKLLADELTSAIEG